MNETLYPVVALAALTFAVLLRIPFVRFRAARAGLVKARDFRYGESAGVPPERGAERRAQRHPPDLQHVFHRLRVFAASNIVLIALRIRWAIALAQAA